MTSRTCRFAAALIAAAAATQAQQDTGPPLDPTALGSSDGGFGLEEASPAAPADAGSSPRDDGWGASAGWGGGGFELESEAAAPAAGAGPGPADNSGCGARWLDRQTRRIDLAMSGGDLRRWASLMADAIRRGCAGPAIDSRIARAESLDAAATQKRDSAMAVAARRTRPELRSNQPRSAGRPLTPQRNNASGWLDVAGALTRLAADYKAARDAPGNRSLGSVAPSRGGSPAPGGQLTMQDVIGDAVITKKAMADDELEEMMQQQRRREGDRGEGGGDRGEGPWREGEVIDVNAIPDEGEPPPPPPKKTCNAQGCCWINVPYSQMVYGLPGLGGQEDELQCRCGKAAGDFTLPAADARACEGAEAP